MSEQIIDTSVLIDFLRGHDGAVCFLDLARSASRLQTHVVVLAELLAGARNAREQAAIDSFTSEFSVIGASESDAFQSLELFRRLHLSHGVDWPDCQIAATAMRLGRTIATQNLKHFAAFSGLEVVKAY